jgi:hypothetical protein
VPLFRRPDGALCTEVSRVRAIMPFIMPTATQSVVFFEQEIDLTKTLPFLEQLNAQNPGMKAGLFHLVLHAVARTLNERPRLNRFVAGSRLYQREGIYLTYAAKKALHDEAPIVTLKRRFDPAHNLLETVRFVDGDVRVGRSDAESHTDRELKLFLKLPAPLLVLGVRVLQWLDWWNLLPRAFIEGDPMYCSVFVANLGSVRLESAFHHLYEWGNCPFFATIGRRKTVVTPEGPRRVCSIKYTFDERIEDGLYCATALERVKAILEDPAAHA